MTTIFGIQTSVLFSKGSVSARPTLIMIKGLAKLETPGQNYTSAGQWIRNMHNAGSLVSSLHHELALLTEASSTDKDTSGSRWRLFLKL